MSDKTLKTIGVDPLIREHMEKREKAKQELTNIVFAVQAECKHENVFECEYDPQNSWDNGKPPRRMCVNCRLEENGWGSGYKILKNDRNIIPATRDQLCSLIIHY